MHINEVQASMQNYNISLRHSTMKSIVKHYGKNHPCYTYAGQHCLLQEMTYNISACLLSDPVL